jgi:hypothetical protein
VMPSRPTLTRLASSVPSSFLTAPKMMTLAPAFSSDLSPATKVTIGVPGGTTTFFSPSLYLTRMFCPSVPLTVCATVALVMVEFGRWSQGLKPSVAPRWFSGNMWTSIIQPPATSGDGADQARPVLELFGADVASRSPNDPLYPGGQRSAGHSTWCR